MTTRIQVSDTGLEVVPPRDTLTQGSENTITLEFEFTGAWLLCNEYNAVFTDDINSATVPVTGGACVVPVEVLQYPWRFVSISLNGTSAGGVITSPFVRIGQVLPSATGGEGGKFVTMAQLMEILQGYVKAEDLGVYVTHDELQAAIATLATQADIAQLDEAKADKTTVAALAGTVAAQGVEIQNKSDAATVTALETRVGTNETNIAALQNGKADKEQLEGYWSKAGIGLQTDGDGKEFLANDGKYYPIQGGTQVQANWNDADTTSPAYIQNKPTIPDVSGLATQASVDAVSDTVSAIDTRVGTNEADITALQTDKADKTAVQALADEVTGKASAADLQAAQSAIAANTAAIATKADSAALDALSAAVADKANAADVQALSDIVDGKADESALADYWSKQEIGLQTAGTGTLFLADDGTYKPAAGDPPDLSAYLTKTEAGSTYETQTHAAETYATKADIPDVSGFETAEHAAATYATKAELPDVSDMLTKTEAAGTYATASALTGVQGDVEANTAAIAENASDIAAAVLDIQTLGNTVASKADAATVTTLQTDVQALGEAMNGKASAADLSALQTEVAGKASQAQVDTIAGDVQTLRTDVDELDVAQNALDGRVTAVETALAGKVDTVTLGDYETTAHAQQTQAALQADIDAKASAADLTAAQSDIATNTAAIATNVAAIAAQDSRIGANESDISTLQTDKADKTQLADYETTAHAAATYASKDYVDQRTTTVMATGTSGSWGSEYTKVIEQANGGNITFYRRVDRDAAGTRTIFSVDGTQLVTADTAPDFSTLVTKTEAESTYLKIADASPIKSITDGDIALTPDANGNVTVGRTSVTVATTPTNPPAISCGIKEYAPDGASANSGAMMFISVADPVTGSADTYKTARVQITDNQNNSAFANLVSQEWVKEYIASLDGTNMQF